MVKAQFPAWLQVQGIVQLDCIAMLDAAHDCLTDHQVCNADPQSQPVALK